MLMSVSHRYSQHFTPVELIDAFAPSEETISAVTNWLVKLTLGFPVIDYYCLLVRVGYMLMLRLLRLREYHVYTHPSGNPQIGEYCPYFYDKWMIYNYSVASHLWQHVDLIKPTVQFDHQPAFNGRPSAGRGSRSKKSSNLKRTEPFTPSRIVNCTQVIDLDCLRTM